MGLADEKHLAFTTFKRDGTPVTTAVWVVGLDGGRLGFWTSSGSGKAKRLKNNPKITVQPCNSRGKLTEGTTPTDGTAVTATSGPELDEIRPKIKAKYGVMVPITRLLNNTVALIKRKKQPYGDTGVIITLT